MSKYINFTPYIDESTLGCATASLMCWINSQVWLSRSTNRHNQTINLINKIKSDKPYPFLSGLKVKCNNSLIRFHIGLNHRLILMRPVKNFGFLLFNRKNYNLNFKQKFSSLTLGC